MDAEARTLRGVMAYRPVEHARVPTIRASRWRGIVATRDALDLRDPEVGAVPTGLLVWLIGG
ncbi:MAG: hypothetical protein OXQ94_07005 [Gemmatimonadota bacterium]|nr:hypothetical protein [Gemmatimonadota bacterium]MDE2871424.1 hypothetical protein [Gemmatimonadota bacterium]